MSIGARALVGMVTAALAFSCTAVSASQRDVHFYAVYALGLASGLSEADALLISRASESLDENAETSPMPDEHHAVGNVPWYTERAALWHSLPPNVLTWYVMYKLRGELPKAEDLASSDQQMVQRQLVYLYDRAVNERDNDTSKVFFGQYLHALADSVTHAGFHNLFGHLSAWTAPDVPSPENRSKTEKLLSLSIGAYAQYSRQRLHQTPRVITSDVQRALATAVTCDAPCKPNVDDREELVRSRLESELRRQGLTEKVPAWTHSGSGPENGDGTIKPIPFDYDGNIKWVVDAAGHRTYAPIIAPRGGLEEIGSISSRLGTAAKDIGAASTAALSPAARDVHAVLDPLGLSDVSLGGIDLSAVTLRYVADVPSATGGRAFVASLERAPPGESVPASVSFLAFATTLILPDSAWWVNLNPGEPDRVTDVNLGGTDIGRALLEADLELKRLNLELFDPQSPTGSAYWRSVTGGAFPHFFANTVERVWIVPGDCAASVTDGGIEIGKCNLDVRHEIKRFTLLDERNQEVAEPTRQQRLRFERQLDDTLILPALRTAVNHDRRFAELRTIYRARALALAYKFRFGRTGSMRSAADSRDMQLLPRPTKRDPRAIWLQYVSEYNAQGSRTKVTLPNGDELQIQSGGIVLDGIPLRTSSDTEVDAFAPPLSLNSGILVAASRGTHEPIVRSPFLIAALLANQEAANRADVASTYELLNALAMTDDSDYATVRSNAPPEVLVAFSEALRSSAGKAAFALPAAYAAWTRLHPLEARRRVASLALRSGDLPEILTYLAAVESAPRAEDPDPERVDDLYSFVLADVAARKLGRAEFTMMAGGLSVQAVPRSAVRFSRMLMLPAIRNELYRRPDDVLEVARVEALFDVKAAADLIVALNTSYDAAGLVPPDSVSEQARGLFRLAAFLRQLEKSPDPAAKIWMARFQWVTDPSQAVGRALAALRSDRSSISAKERDKLITDAAPLLAWGAPREAQAFASTIRDPARRSEAFSWLAMFSENEEAAGILLVQELARQAEAASEPPAVPDVRR